MLLPMTILSLALAAVLASLQPAPSTIAAPEAVAPAEDLVRVALETDKGPILLELDRGRAPLTAQAFLDYVDKGWLTSANFYRAMPYGDAGIAQFGVRRTDRLLPAIAHESTADTRLLHKRGSISLIAPEPGQGQADWFIALNDIPGFDASDSFHGFTPFGRVIEGMEVVEAIFAAPVDPDAGEGVMKGQMLAEPVKISDAEISE